MNPERQHALASFEKFVFEKSAYFSSATFSSDAYFRSATFSSLAFFSSAKFSSLAFFSSAMFDARTKFDDVRFLTAVPEFFAADIYEDTTFTLPENYRDNWPPMTGAVIISGSDEPQEVMSAKEQKRAYNRLRLFMNKNLQVEEEQFFHRQEMRCKKITDHWSHRPVYWLFEIFSDYGNSVGRPMAGLFALWVVGIMARLEWSAGNIWADAGSTTYSMGWSFANLFPFFGFRRLYFSGENLTTWQSFIGGAETVAGFILLFLLGLGLRNRFRLR